MATTSHRAVLAALLLTGAMSGVAWAQQSTSTTKETGNTLTGGAEGSPTDQGTPRGPASNMQTQPQTSGASETGNTMTGGAEGSPTDKGTPARPASARDVAPGDGKQPQDSMPRQ